MKILLIEDEPALQEVVRTSLEKERYVVELKKDRRHYEVKLSNKLEMEFSLDGKLLRYD